MTPPPADRPRLLPKDVRRPAPAGVARLQRGLVLGGVAGCVATGFTVAPYATFLLMSMLALAVRTFSWTTEAARERQHFRGRRRWYDAPLTLASFPWYLVVATGGTVMLVAWAAMVTSVLGLGIALFSPPVMPALFVLGVVLVFCLWVGPGAKRLRLPVRRVVGLSSRDVWVGWTLVAAVAIVLVALVVGAMSGQVSWAPADGAPWRPGTLLGDLLRWV